MQFGMLWWVGKIQTFSESILLKSSLLKMQNSCCLRSEFDVPVYNFTHHKDNICRWKDFVEICCRRLQDRPPLKAVWYCSMCALKSATAFIFLCFLIHTLPALLVDTVLVLINKKPK